MCRPIRCGVLASCSCVLLLAAPQTVFAQCEKARTHRPVEDLFASDVVYLQEQGEVQLEVKPARTREGGVRTSTLEMDIEYGQRDWWQIETEWDAREWTRAADGTVTSQIGDIGIGTRFGWRCIGGSRYHLSVGLDVSIPSDTIGNAREARRHVGLASAVIVARDVGHTMHVFSTLEVEAPLNRRDAQASVPDWSYASDTGMFVRIVRGFRVTAELSVEGGPDQEREVHFLPGVLWHRGDVIEIGVGMLAPLSHDTSRGLLAHVVCEFGGRHETK
jgi:hypothetical protein